MHTTEAHDGLYCGADLHGNNVFLTLCDGQGQRVMERRVKANLVAVNTALDPYWERIQQVAVESTYNWYWFVDGLRAQGRDVRLANPAKMDQYAGLKAADDASDAGWIAEQMRRGRTTARTGIVIWPGRMPKRCSLDDVQGGGREPGRGLA